MLVLWDYFTLKDDKAKFLSAPCTSVESERLFSAVSLIADEHRSRLTPEHTEMLVFVKNYLSIMLGLQARQTVGIEGSVWGWSSKVWGVEGILLLNSLQYLH